MESNFMRVYRDIRTFFPDLHDKAHLVLHTSVGAIKLGQFSIREDSGHVAIVGRDESGTVRCLVFSEEQLAFFPIEMQRKEKAKGKNRSIGFNLENAVEVSK